MPCRKITRPDSIADRGEVARVTAEFEQFPTTSTIYFHKLAQEIGRTVAQCICAGDRAGHIVVTHRGTVSTRIGGTEHPTKDVVSDRSGSSEAGSVGGRATRNFAQHVVAQRRDSAQRIGHGQRLAEVVHRPRTGAFEGRADIFGDGVDTAPIVIALRSRTASRSGDARQAVGSVGKAHAVSIAGATRRRLAGHAAQSDGFS
jgi:hypothetical protein